MHLIYENKYGIVSMGNTSDRWRIIDIKGLNLTDKTYSVIRYAAFGGQETVYTSSDARIITVSGDVYSENLKEEMERALRIFNEEGSLSVISKDKQRLIKCSRITFNEVERMGSYLKFTLQFICDNPYFFDLFPTVTGVFDTTGLLKTSFTLPCTFSTRNNKRYIVNQGDINTEPIFKIYLQNEAELQQGDERGYKITNLTTNQMIWLKYQLCEGEVVTIDIPGRSIESNIYGNIIINISDDTFLNDFTLQKGENLISVLNYNANETVKVECIYDNMYVEAVY
ncbi:MAG: hypothetical protein E7391_05645 [Ruminococcaceae bacterium]|nr:hypothetical protein [Oscillospiraceae bacterium]